VETEARPYAQRSAVGYDANNHLISVADPSGRSVHYSYDPSGNLISYDDALLSGIDINQATRRKRYISVRCKKYYSAILFCDFSWQKVSK